MKLNRKWLTTALIVVALAVLGVGAALAISESPEITEHAEVEDANESAGDSAEDQAEGEDTPISDQDALKTASEKALAWLKTEHGVTGTVSDTEVGDEESYYEIEVTLEDGRHVDVQLTKTFEIVGLD